MKRFPHGGIFWHEGLDFSANINPMGLPRRIKELALQNFEDCLHYPEPYSDTLRMALADYTGLKSENILVGNGSIELIYLVCERTKPNRTLIAYPTFNEYEYASRLYGSKVSFFKEERLMANISLLSRNDLCFICNPNNPTGYLYAKEDIFEALTILKRNGAYLLIDEAFIEFVEGLPTNIFEVKNYRNLIVLRSFTKFFAMPGMRLGYLACQGALRKRLEEAQYPWAVNALAQRLSLAILKEKGFMKESQGYVQKERAYLFKCLNGLDGIDVHPPSANFLFCKAKFGKRLCSELAKRKLFLRNLADFRGLNEDFFRIAVRRHAENVLLIKNIKEVAEKLFFNTNSHE